MSIIVSPLGSIVADAAIFAKQSILARPVAGQKRFGQLAVLAALRALAVLAGTACGPAALPKASICRESIRIGQLAGYLPRIGAFRVSVGRGLAPAVVVRDKLAAAAVNPDPAAVPRKKQPSA
jgi:hypothetical protein